MGKKLPLFIVAILSLGLVGFFLVNSSSKQKATPTPVTKIIVSPTAIPLTLESTITEITKIEADIQLGLDQLDSDLKEISQVNVSDDAPSL